VGKQQNGRKSQRREGCSKDKNVEKVLERGL